MDPRTLSIQDYTYDLPEARIAQQPLAERDASKLLLFDKGVIRDHSFRSLPDLIPSNALLVLNNTKVVNARLIFHRASGARIEVLCLSPVEGKPVELAFVESGSSEWECFIGNAKRWKAGEELIATANGLEIRAMRKGQESIRLAWTPVELSFVEVLDRIGHVPLPPYMKRPDEAADKTRYNTVFAQYDGSVAAPTASLHFTKEILDRIVQRGIRSTDLTLHVGAGTFLPVKSATMDQHAMHSEQVRIPLKMLLQLSEQLGKGPVIPVGTTALRTLESIYWHGVKLLRRIGSNVIDIDQWDSYSYDENDLPTPKDALNAVIMSLMEKKEYQLSGETKLLIAPGYTFRFATGLVTNFHQPQSTLLLLVAAFLGKDWRSVYDHALASDYRFLSYGDGSLLLP
ncbi:MAG: S-adenosylmethionine:tRNA ribosyltransferase-isomerase [Flavobacteriales bacterium]|nr:S-adenosylmethionine:tRNA ribosyltransferase-isomerase [Flavobacteriales bacterium]MBK6945920.1 S-adenosylmethionine:tRNA ribosyltransferase-isomerase [Flavobacteriales bacterium]MBK7239144.1 S-adenosylmethionine:tRNA ribosyltransferase-isomerase [Flavobacteriales bacterium]MBK9536749.1 S-adenosylmethionine:tRNA ribosyltransferase-isomerase [Flavobacteriales bacterium]MBP9138229.1 S-adenosylmethionine:tRNA ribosyltransferase-isomerase [Flavobacteriales bacterium]